MSKEPDKELMNVVIEWDRAMVENDPATIGRYMADDWIIIGPDGSVSDKANFLAMIESGSLTHNVMESHDLNVRIYEDMAIVIARGISGGNFNGQSFYLNERSSCVFVWTNEEWKCVSTHLSLISDRY